MTTGFQIGSTFETLADLDALTTPVPRPLSPLKPFYDYVLLSDGTKRGLGSAVVVWRWGFLSLDEREQLRTFCSGPTAPIYIRTQTSEDDDGFAVYSGIINWPEEAEDRMAGRRLDFVLTFTRLVLIPEEP